MALNQDKLDRILAKLEVIEGRLARLEAQRARADDQGRDADGKFASGGGAAGGGGDKKPAFGGGSSREASGAWEKKGKSLRLGFKAPSGKTQYHEVNEVGPGEVYTTTHGHTRKHGSVEDAKKYVEETIAANTEHNASVAAKLGR